MSSQWWEIHFLLIDPFILPHQQVDKGAIKFVLSGANIMCPGLTSPGAKLYPAGADTVVVSFLQMKLFELIFNSVEYICELVLCHKYFPRFTILTLQCLDSICSYIFVILPTSFIFNKRMQAIMAEGKQHALCVGVMKMSAESM